MLSGICPSMSRTPKLWHMYVTTYGDFMVIDEPCTVPFKLLINTCKYVNIRRDFYGDTRYYQQ